jgi:hypothetical protein
LRRRTNCRKEKSYGKVYIISDMYPLQDYPVGRRFL